MAAQYGMEADKLKEYLGEAEKESIKRDLSVTKAVDLIMENVKERAKAKTKKEKEAEAKKEQKNNSGAQHSNNTDRISSWLYEPLFELWQNAFDEKKVQYFLKFEQDINFS